MLLHEKQRYLSNVKLKMRLKLVPKAQIFYIFFILVADTLKSNALNLTLGTLFFLYSSATRP